MMKIGICLNNSLKHLKNLTCDSSKLKHHQQNADIERVVNRLPLITYGLKMSNTNDGEVVGSQAFNHSVSLLELFGTA